jgi:hypothetical protein
MFFIAALEAATLAQCREATLDLSSSSERYCSNVRTVLDVLLTGFI